MRRPLAVCLFACLSACVWACSGQVLDEGNGAWQGTITTEGNVTTVVNESGSVWGGAAKLVERLSIGVAEGEEPYLLGVVTGLAMLGDRIYVLDRAVPALRVYDLEGRHVMDIGAAGEGPGEFRIPFSLAIGPGERLYVRDDGVHRMSIFDLEGEILDTWALPTGFGTVRHTVVTEDGAVYIPQIVERGPGPGPRNRRLGMVPYGPEGVAGEPRKEPESGYEPPLLKTSTGQGPVPFSPRPTWDMTPSGAIVGGVPKDYSFEVQHADGRITKVEKVFQPVAIEDGEAEWHKRRTTALYRNTDPGFTWNAPEIPAAKPAYEELFGDLSGRIWVRRKGKGARLANCDENPDSTEPPLEIRACWKDEQILDVFEEEGRYLGGVACPVDISFLAGKPSIRDDLVLLTTEDEAGTITVKLYRLVLPGEE